MPQSDWPRAFWLLPQRPDLLQIYNFRRFITNNINFHYWPNSGKINDIFFNKLKKIFFWPIFLIFWAKHFFQKIQLLHTISYQSPTPCHNLEKNNNPIPRKFLHRKTNGWMEGWTDPIHRTFMQPSWS